MTDHFTETVEVFAADVAWTCGLCSVGGTEVTGVGRESLELHMNDHIAGALEGPVRMVFDLRLPRLRPEPVLVDVAQYGAGYAVAGQGSDTVLAVCADRAVAEYFARLWNLDHSP
jgi:hypothetical protein